MRNLGKLLLVTVTVAAVAAAGTFMAYAAWPVRGTGAAVQVRAAELPRGPRPDVARDGANAVLTWAPQQITPGHPVQGYVVRRRKAGSPSGLRTFAPVAGTTFTDTQVPAGTWSWTVTPTFAAWTGDESRESENLAFTATVEPPHAPVRTTSPVAPAVPDPASTPPAAGEEPVHSPAPAGTTPDPGEPAPPPTAAPQPGQTGSVDPGLPPIDTVTDPADQG